MKAETDSNPNLKENNVQFLIVLFAHMCRTLFSLTVLSLTCAHLCASHFELCRHHKLFAIDPSAIRLDDVLLMRTCVRILNVTFPHLFCESVL